MFFIGNNKKLRTDMKDKKRLCILGVYHVQKSQPINRKSGKMSCFLGSGSYTAETKGIFETEVRSLGKDATSASKIRHLSR